MSSLQLCWNWVFIPITFELGPEEGLGKTLATSRGKWALRSWSLVFSKCCPTPKTKKCQKSIGFFLLGFYFTNPLFQLGSSLDLYVSEPHIEKLVTLELSAVGPWWELGLERKGYLKVKLLKEPKFFFKKSGCDGSSHSKNGQKSIVDEKKCSLKKNHVWVIKFWNTKHFPPQKQPLVKPFPWFLLMEKTWTSSSFKRFLAGVERMRPCCWCWMMNAMLWKASPWKVPWRRCMEAAGDSIVSWESPPNTTFFSRK